MIRDTSSQDAVLSAPPGQRHKKRALLLAGAVIVIGGAVAVFAGWRNSEHSVNASRLRIADVTRGTLIRDAAVNGRVVAAISPTLYSTTVATVTLKAKAGDTVKKGDILAVLEWQPGQALLRQGDQTRQFTSVEAMAAELTGAPIPVRALFAWLRGQPEPVQGWQADLTQLPSGRVNARREMPLRPKGR